MSEKIEIGDIARVIDRLRSRAKKHRYTALVYTLSIFASIAIGLLVYYLFSISDLEVLEEETKNLKNELQSNLILITNSTKEINRITEEARDSVILKLRRIELLMLSANNLLADYSNSNEAFANSLNSYDNLPIFQLLSSTQSSFDSLLSTNSDERRSLDFYVNFLGESGMLRSKKYDSIVNILQRKEFEFESSIQRLNAIQSNLYSDSVFYKRYAGRNRFLLKPTAKSIREILQNTKEFESSLNEIVKQTSSYAGILDTLQFEQKREFENANQAVIKLSTLLDKYETTSKSTYDGAQSDLREVYRSISSNKVLSNDVENKLIRLSNFLEGRNSDILSTRYVMGDIDESVNSIRKEIMIIDQVYDKLKQQFEKHKSAENQINSISNIALRYGVVIFLIYIIQLLLSFNKYHYRLASFYDSRADSLLMGLEVEKLDPKELFESMDSSGVLFGKESNIYKKAFDIFREFISKSKVSDK